MNNEESLKERIVHAALVWRRADEYEPIGSTIPNDFLRILGFKVDEYNCYLDRCNVKS